ncbi:MAG: hypothetical protein FD174_637 [Geobacteraceae bacterium]|nr:MAG: hypothetical protein FD174_637 [Geobacteraceae bacterium]
MDGKKNNPAGRLHAILTQALNSPGSTSTLQMWSQVFDIPLQEKTELFLRISAMHQLVDDVKSRISSLDDVNVELHLSRFPQIEVVVKATNYDVPWDSYKPHLSDGVMLNLAYCAETLSRYDETPIEENDLLDLKKDIDELFEKILKAPLDGQLKTVILDLLESIRRSISEYKIRGADGMRKTLAYCMGMIVQNTQLFEKEASKEEVGRFGKIVSRFTTIIELAVKFKELGVNYSKVIGFIITTANK